MNNEKFRFLVAGGTNTVATYLLYLALLRVLPYQAAYTGSYVAGIVLSYALSTLFVFREKWSWKKLAAFPLVYVLQYGLGVGVVSLLVEVGHVPKTLAPLLAVAVTLPVTFLTSRALIKTRSI